jgi:hypothetical protein
MLKNIWQVSSSFLGGWGLNAVAGWTLYAEGQFHAQQRWREGEKEAKYLKKEERYVKRREINYIKCS